MEPFHEKVYDFIFTLFDSDIVKEKVEDTFSEIGEGFFYELASSKKFSYHQAYIGGLADHVALATLDAYHFVLTKPWFGIKTDDILVAALFHDLDKVGRYSREIERLSTSDRQTAKFLEGRAMLNNNILEGVLLAHGGWSNCKDVEHTAIAVCMHAGDMMASHVTKRRAETREIIKKIMNKIMELNGI
jgi:hypothetical protein